jgi:hypothetical protein
MCENRNISLTLITHSLPQFGEIWTSSINAIACMFSLPISLITPTNTVDTHLAVHAPRQPRHLLLHRTITSQSEYSLCHPSHIASTLTQYTYSPTPISASASMELGPVRRTHYAIHCTSRQHLCIASLGASPKTSLSHSSPHRSLTPWYFRSEGEMREEEKIGKGEGKIYGRKPEGLGSASYHSFACFA